MRTIARLAAPAAAIALCGCATGNGELPLIFGSYNAAGIVIGTSASDTTPGGEFVIGYKGIDIAVIPVSMVDSNGEKFVGASNRDGTVKDSYSVIGQFSAGAKKQSGGGGASLGKFFATGIAAQKIADGYSRKMGFGTTTVENCKSEPSPPQSATGKTGIDEPREIDAKLFRVAEPAPAASGEAAAAGSKDSVKTTEGKDSAKTGARLIFAQYEYYALAIDGSGLSGVNLTVGYRDRNLALIPVVGRDAKGNLVHLEGTIPKGTNTFSDTFSVLGQFGASTDAKSGTTDGGSTDKGATISSGLEKFFSTGSAARVLSDGFRVKLCEEYVAPTQK